MRPFEKVGCSHSNVITADLDSNVSDFIQITALSFDDGFIKPRFDFKGDV